jgi:hypothetical protein
VTKTAQVELKVEEWKPMMPGTDFAVINDFAQSRHWQEFDWIFNGHVWMYIAEVVRCKLTPGCLHVDPRLTPG